MLARKSANQLRAARIQRHGVHLFPDPSPGSRPGAVSMYSRTPFGSRETQPVVAVRSVGWPQIIQMKVGRTGRSPGRMATDAVSSMSPASGRPDVALGKPPPRQAPGR